MAHLCLFIKDAETHQTKQNSNQGLFCKSSSGRNHKPEPAAKPEADDTRFNVASNLKISPQTQPSMKWRETENLPPKSSEFLGKTRNGFQPLSCQHAPQPGRVSTIKIDSMGGWNFNQSKQGTKYAAAWPKTDTVCTLHAARGGRHILHEFRPMAATLRPSCQADGQRWK